MTPAQFMQWMVDPARRPLVMGILNRTPDSFSDGGIHSTIDAALSGVGSMLEAGADLIDVGGESTRPGSNPIDPLEQIVRVERIIATAFKTHQCAISIDTGQSQVARAAVQAGACMVNDVYAGNDDPALLPAVAELKVLIILGHIRGRPSDMMSRATYSDVVEEVSSELSERIVAAKSAGIDASNILIDPGIGFAKRAEHDLAILKNLREFTRFNCPLVVGVSRKKFIGAITGQNNPGDRTFGTAAAVAWSVANGADIVRVHDVAAMSQVVRTIEAIQKQGR